MSGIFLCTIYQVLKFMPGWAPPNPAYICQFIREVESSPPCSGFLSSRRLGITRAPLLISRPRARMAREVRRRQGCRLASMPQVQSTKARISDGWRQTVWYMDVVMSRRAGCPRATAGGGTPLWLLPATRHEPEGTRERKQKGPPKRAFSVHVCNPQTMPG